MTITREMLEQDLVHLSNELRRMNEAIRQVTADANATKGAIEYIQNKLREMGNGDGSVNNPDRGQEPTGRDDGAVLD